MKLNKKTLLTFSAVVSATMIASTMVAHAATPRTTKTHPPVVATYSVTYNANGGTGSQGKSSAKSGSSVTLPISDFVPPTGKQFSAWNTKSNGTGTSYAPGAKLVLSANITLYAQWIPRPVPTCTPKSGKPGYPPKPCSK